MLGAGRVCVALSREIVSAALPFAGLWNRSAMERPGGLGGAEFEYLMNGSRFIARNQDVRMLSGTTSCEAVHGQMAKLFLRPSSR